MFLNYLNRVIILPIFDVLQGGNLSKNLKLWEKYDKLKRNELLEIQRKNLSSLLNHAKKNIDYYKNIDIDFTSDVFEEVKKFPLMNKSEIRENLDKMVWGDKSKYIKEASSGSSGVQGVVYLDKNAQSMHRSIQLHWWKWAGYSIGDRVIQTGMTTNRGFIKSIKDFLFRTNYYPAFQLNEIEVIELLKSKKTSKTNFLLGYASSLFVISNFAKNNNLNEVKFKSVVSWGDKMFPHFRKQIEEQFSTKVYDTYACTEGAMIAGQCKEGSYHIMIPQVFLEVLDDNGNPVKNGDLGKVYVTRLDNLAMPLIRYYLGDLVELEDSKMVCSCGMNYPLLKRVIGRDTDIVKTKSGKYMIVHFFTGIFEHIAEVKQFRVIQENLDRILIEIIPGPNYGINVEKLIISKIENYLNESFPIEFKIVEVIPNTKSGKPQLIQSFLNQSNS